MFEVAVEEFCFVAKVIGELRRAAIGPAQL
jgi:hypothetical protein